MASYRSLEITLISAKDLKDVNLFSKMSVYAVITVDKQRHRTPAAKECGTDPSWNQTFKFTIPSATNSNQFITILLRSERSMGDRDIGEVHIPIRELLDTDQKHNGTTQFLSYQVRKPNSGRAKGVLNISYKLGEVIAQPTPEPMVKNKAGNYFGGDEPVTAYPAAAGPSYPPPGYAAPPQAGYGYPAHAAAPQAGYGYPPPPQAGYGYPPQQQAGYGYPPPPQQAGYGYPPQAGYGYGAPVAQPAKKNKFGMGLGAGLLGGALGGMILGDMVSDGGAYDSGYDGGFGDGMDY